MYEMSGNGETSEIGKSESIKPNTVKTEKERTFGRKGNTITIDEYNIIVQVGKETKTKLTYKIQHVRYDISRGILI